MPKIITSRRRESEIDRARSYIKSRTMMPIIPLGMVTLLTGYGSLVVTWFEDKLTGQTLLISTALFLLGVGLGWAHVRYERYLVTTYPEHFARKKKLLDAAKEYKRPKGDLPTRGPAHRGRTIVWFVYGLAICGIFGLSIAYANQLGVYTAFFLPWAGYFNAKVIFWRDLFVS
jgi:hypothetical protein